jgi:hypothetical protein
MAVSNKSDKSQTYCTLNALCAWTLEYLGLNLAILFHT